MRHEIDTDQLRADIEAGTPGRFSIDAADPRRVNASTGRSVFRAHLKGVMSDKDAAEARANARRAAHIPDLEAAYLDLQAKADKMADALTRIEGASRHYALPYGHSEQNLRYAHKSTRNLATAAIAEYRGETE